MRRRYTLVRADDGSVYDKVKPRPMTDREANNENYGLFVMGIKTLAWVESTRIVNGFATRPPTIPADD